MPDMISCLAHGELVHLMQKHCAPNEYFLQNTFFPRVNIRRPMTDMLNLLEFGDQFTGPAQFNSQCLKANVIATGEAVDLKAFKLPYIHEKQPIAACNLDSYMVNFNTGDVITDPEQKYQLAQAWFGKLSVERVKIALEIMAAEIISKGKATLRGSNIPEIEIDFGRDPANDIVLDADALWCNPNSTPLQDLENWAVLGNCGGMAPTDVYFTPAAWKEFIKHQDVQDAIKVSRATANNAMPLVTNISGAPVRPSNGAISKGFIGDYQLFVLPNSLVIKKPDGSKGRVDLFEDGDVFMIDATRFYGMPVWGAIRDAMQRVMQGNPNIYYWSKICDDPKGVEQHYEAKPLLIPGDVNAVIKAKVTGCS